MDPEEQIAQNSLQVDGESEKLRQMLLEKRDKLEQKNNIINSKSIASENETSLNKEKIIADIFKLMQSYGVDLNDQASISKFIVELEQKDPDLKDLFEYAFDSLMGGNDDIESDDDSEDVSDQDTSSLPTTNFPLPD